MAAENSNETVEHGVEDTHRSLGKALLVFWLACFAAVGALTVAGMPDRSTTVEVPTGPLRAEDGTWALEPVREVCRQALEAHGVDSSTLTPLEFEDGQLFKVNDSRPEWILTAWEVAEDRRRVTVSVDVDGAVARCEVTESE